ncbi:MAG: sigma-54 dependent transcriptional regulator [Planctomycetota bacterium]|nr:sigma-54 dependent transcriptional regulator [Planctomycetota bacterium]
MSDRPRILIVDDDPIVAESVAEFLRKDQWVTATAFDGAEALEMIDAASAGPLPADEPGQSDGATPSAPFTAPFGVVIADANMPRTGGLELLRNIRRKHPSIAVIIVTGFGKIEGAVEAIKLGAVDYLIKPVVDDELRMAVDKALQQHVLLAENQTLRSQLTQRFGLGNLVGSDYRMQKVYDLVEAVAESKTTVLIDGESGTGKTMVARAIHTRSPRRAGPFVTFSCGSIPETLLESELFGHVKGAFTGAESDKPGKCLAANGGTLFIDEINSATPALQLKLLRVLQERQFEPLGSTRTVSVDVRFVLATNQSLRELIAKGLFREDLYYRINVVAVQLPPLRDRVGDVPVLAEHFLERYCKESGKRIQGFTDEALALMRRYPWPGNVRELENAIERGVVLARRPIIDVDDLPDTLRGEGELAGVSSGGERLVRVNGSHASGSGGASGGGGGEIAALAGGWTPMPLAKALEDPERQILLAALRANEWNRQETARQLDINRTTLYKKIKQFGLEGLG